MNTLQQLATTQYSTPVFVSLSPLQTKHAHKRAGRSLLDNFQQNTDGGRKLHHVISQL
jgi:hypothetical protein